MKLNQSTIKNWYHRVRSYGMRNAIMLKHYLRKDCVFIVRYSGYDIQLRGNSVDFNVFDSIFRKGEYDFEINFKPEFIIDAGAFTGLSALYFNRRFPGVKILAIEPEESNFGLLKSNTGNYASITPLFGALYGSNVPLTISNPAAEKYAFRVDEISSGANQINGWSIDELIKSHRLPRIDLLKMDIEGAEYSVFMNDPGRWLGNVGGVIIELHEYLHKGVTALVEDTLKTSGFVISQKGENLVALRPDWLTGCLPEGQGDTLNDV